MKSVSALCAASLAINVALVVCLAIRLHTANGVARGTAMAVTPAHPAGLSEETKRLLAGSSLENLGQLRDRLREEGLPESVVRDVIEQRLWKAQRGKLDAADPAKKRPWWQQVSERIPGDDVKMGRLESQTIADYKRRMRELFPEAEGDHLAPETAFLAPEKRKALQKVLDDYSELESRAYMDAGVGPTLPMDQQRFTYLRDEKEKDMQALLSPADYEELQLHDLRTNFSLRKAAALLNLSEQQFRGILAIDKWKSTALSSIGNGADPFAPLPPEKQGFYDRLTEEERNKRLELLGPEKAYLYDWVDGGGYDAVARYVARFDQPPDRINDYFHLTNKARDEVAELVRNSTLSPEQRALSLNALGQTYEKLLKELMGPAAMESDLGLGNLINELKSKK